MDKTAFLRLCKNNYQDKDYLFFEEIVDFLGKYFMNIKRLSGESVFEHNLNIGKILIESGVEKEVVAAGLLYGIETEVSHSDLKNFFGEDVADLVFGQLQLKSIKSKTKEAESEVLRKVLLAALKDVRILFVKLASKLDNMGTIDVFPKAKQIHIAQEVLDIYAPLASRLGLENLKRNLDDLAFKIVKPKKYAEIVKFLKSSESDRKKFIKDFIQNINYLLKGVKVCKIKGREKHIYSIYKKIVNRKVPLNEQKDHYAIRIIVQDISDCYNVLGILHKEFENVSGTLKDYIANPKENGYQSIHTIVKVDKNEVEIQIRTKEMDFYAEEGGAAHWAYKKMSSDAEFERKVAWLRSILDNSNISKELLKSVKASLLEDKFYCYTPRGKAISLPKGATILDFAYHIHQEIGNKAVGGRVNGVFASLKKELKSSDVVEVITNKHQRPRRDWIKFVVSARAKAIIKKEIKKHEGVSISSKFAVLKNEKSKFDSLVYSNEFPNHKFILAKCCFPIPNNRIIGVIKSHKKILVHDEKCSKINGIKDRVVPVFWKETFNRPIVVLIEAKDRAGILADLLNTLSREGFVIKDASAKMVGNDISECRFVIVPQKIENIVKLVKRISKIRGFKRIRFE